MDDKLLEMLSIMQTLSEEQIKKIYGYVLALNYSDEQRLLQVG